MKFYTHFTQHKNYIYVRGYDNGKPFKNKISYSPYLFVDSKSKNSKYKTINGVPVDRIDFDSINDARDFVRRYSDVENFKIYGLTNWPYLYIFDEYKGNIDFDIDLIKIANLDIEVAANPEEGFPDIKKADKEITAITIRIKGEVFAFGCGTFVTEDPKVTYIKCKNEIELLEKFLDFWNQPNFNPDVMTGWNIQGFDIPYIVNRIINVLSVDDAKRLSPWKTLVPKTYRQNFREQETFEIVGISTLDYIDLYKKFAYTPQESYKLDNVAFNEVGEKKLDYNEYGNLLGLYKQNFQKFMEYNIHDTKLVELLDDKHKFIELVYTMAYDAKVNFEDTLKTVRPWDIIIHNFLLQRSIVIPQHEDIEYENISGGFVKEPVLGIHEWVVSLDLDSLYPHLMMQYNQSPDTIIGVNNPHNLSVDDILNYKLDPFRGYAIENNFTYTANMCLFSRKKHGFLAEIMDTMYKQRKEYKSLMLEYKKKLESCEDEKEKHKLKNLISKYKNLQLVKKIQMNACYGATANQYFRYYNSDFAASITMSGQLTVKWVMRDINKYFNKLLSTKDVDYILAADTDSVYINFGPLVKLLTKEKPLSNEKIVDILDEICKTKLNDVIEKSYHDLYVYMNAYENKMHMKRESIASKAIWTGAKNYILNIYDNEGVRYKTPQIKMVGVPAIKTSYPQFVRNALKNAIEIIMNEKEEDLIKFVEKFKNEFFDSPVELIASPRSVNDFTSFIDDDSYSKGAGKQVKAAINYNNFLKKKNLENKYPQIKDGDKIKFIELKKPNPVFDDVIGFLDVFPKEFELQKYINYDQQYEKVFIQPLQIITNVIKWKVENKLTLEDFL